MARTKIFSLSVKAVLLRSMNAVSDDLSNSRETLAARAKTLSQRPVGMVSTQLLAQQEMVALGKRKNGRPLPTTSTSFRRLQRRFSIRKARSDLGLPSAGPPRRQSRKGRRGERSNEVISVFETRGEEKVRFEKPRFVRSA